jgi:hypothetical protein
MDPVQFDKLVSSLGSRQSRRVVCRSLSSGLFAVAPILLGRDLADARKRHPNRPDPCSRIRCGFGTICKNGTCVCPKKKRICGHECLPRCGKHKKRDPETCECR